MSSAQTHQISENPGDRFPGAIPLRDVQVHADVWPVSDLQPESLSLVVTPPGIDISRFASTVQSQRVGQTYSGRSHPRNHGLREFAQDGTDKGAAMSEGGDTDLDLSSIAQPIQDVLHLRDRHSLPGRRTIGPDQDVLAIQSQDGIRSTREGPNLSALQCLKHTPRVGVRHHDTDYCSRSRNCARAGARVRLWHDHSQWWASHSSSDLQLRPSMPIRWPGSSTDDRHCATRCHSQRARILQHVSTSTGTVTRPSRANPSAIIPGFPYRAAMLSKSTPPATTVRDRRR